MADERGIFWVLGAGFSAALGGPQLRELFSSKSDKDARARYPNVEGLFDGGAARVRWLYLYGQSSADIEALNGGFRLSGEVIWSNAEEFLEYLDTAAAQAAGAGLVGPHAARLQNIQRAAGAADAADIVDAARLRKSARRLLAAECNGFLEGADVRSEKWKPFRRWARMLRPADTVATFNYDLVLERLRDAQNEDSKMTDGGSPSAMHVVVPDVAIDNGSLEGSCAVLKLHGSVDWSKHLSDGKPTGKISLLEGAAISGGDRFVAIATPGPTKLEEVLGFKPLWDLACERIRKAASIVFVGFRFPETDAHPREVLLDAIRDSTARERSDRPLQVHVVLGRPGFDSERVESLVNFVGPRSLAGGPNFRTKVHPLWAQDFLAVVNRDHLCPI